MSNHTQENLPLKTERIDSKTIFRGEKLTLRVDTLKMGDRPPADKEIIQHPGSSVMIPITDRGTVLLVKQWRAAQGGYTLELPSGTRDGDEPPRSKPPIASCEKKQDTAPPTSQTSADSSQSQDIPKSIHTATSLPIWNSIRSHKINLKTSWLSKPPSTICGECA